ncbi:MAG: glycosyltransferase family 39 protein [Flavobacteriales bacterium]|nr:glycosyltransferase family 39 protein [Flavobacteriales bacterium]
MTHALSSSGQRIKLLFVLPFGLALFTYAAVRCTTVTFSYDENYTYIRHVIKNCFYQDSFDQMGGNHHLMNVWGMWVSWKLFGSSELALRLPNLLAFLIYLYASARLAMRAGNALLTLALFILLNAHPYAIDFFSLARGYGLSMAWLMLSLWQGYRYITEGERTRHLMLGTVAAGLSSMSHVIMVNYLLAWTAAFGVLLLFAWKREGWRARRAQLAVMLFVPLIALAIVLPAALGLHSGGSLNFGCEDPWKCAVDSLAVKVLYHSTYEKAPIIIIEKALWWMLGICAGSALVVGFMQQARRLRPLLAVALILVFCLLSLWLQHLLFAVPYPMTRTGVFMIPLCFGVLAMALLAWPGKQAIAAVIGSACCIPLVINAKKAANLNHSVEWKTTGDLRDLLDLIAKDRRASTESRPLTMIGSDFEVSGELDYYIRTRGWHWLAYHQRLDTNAFVPSDYYLVEWTGRPHVDSSNWVSMGKSRVSDLELFRDERSRSLSGSILVHEHLSLPPGPGTREFQVGVTRAMLGKELIVSATVRGLEWADTNWLGLYLQLVRKGEVIRSIDHPSHRQVPTYGNWLPASVSLRLSDEVEMGDTLRFLAIPCFGSPVILTSDMDLWVVE